MEWFKNLFKNAGFNDIGSRLQNAATGANGLAFAGIGGLIGGLAMAGEGSSFSLTGLLLGGGLGLAAQALSGIKLFGGEEKPVVTPNTPSISKATTAALGAGAALAPTHGLPPKTTETALNR